MPLADAAPARSCGLRCLLVNWTSNIKGAAPDNAVGESKPSAPTQLAPTDITLGRRDRKLLASWSSGVKGGAVESAVTASDGTSPSTPNQLAPADIALGRRDLLAKWSTDLPDTTAESAVTNPSTPNQLAPTDITRGRRDGRLGVQIDGP